MPPARFDRTKSPKPIEKYDEIDLYCRLEQASKCVQLRSSVCKVNGDLLDFIEAWYVLVIHLRFLWVLGVGEAFSDSRLACKPP